MTNDDFVLQLSYLGFSDVTVGAVFRDLKPRGVVRYTNSHELEVCFFGLISPFEDKTFVFNKECKNDVLNQIKLIIDNYDLGAQK